MRAAQFTNTETAAYASPAIKSRRSFHALWHIDDTGFSREWVSAFRKRLETYARDRDEREIKSNIDTNPAAGTPTTRLAARQSTESNKTAEATDFVTVLSATLLHPENRELIDELEWVLDQAKARPDACRVWLAAMESGIRLTYSHDVGEHKLDDFPRWHPLKGERVYSAGQALEHFTSKQRAADQHAEEINLAIMRVLEHTATCDICM